MDSKNGVTSNLYLNAQSKLIDIEFVQFSDGVYDVTAGVFREDPNVNSQPGRIRLSSMTVSEDTPVKRPSVVRQAWTLWKNRGGGAALS